MFWRLDCIWDSSILYQWVTRHYMDGWVDWLNLVCGLRMPDTSKTDKFSEKFQTAFDPPHFRKIILQLFSEIHEQSIVDDTWLILWYLAETVKFCWNCEIWSKLWYLAGIVIFGWYCDIWLILWYLVKIVIFGWYCDIWLI